jgi:UDP-N-acetylmuramate: L-alanyl-gamma-D-glutamyl-meso-diaminopimelate ligase
MAKHLHFIGIAGHTMSGLALAAKEAGYSVSGTDEKAYPPSTDFLDHNQIKWWRDPEPQHLAGVDKVIVSGGTPPDFPELVAAQQAGIAIESFAQFWGEIIKDEYSIVVSGTHGKTTTTALIAWLLEDCGKKPDFLVGITPKNFSSSVRYAGGRVAVTEGDEYQSSQLEATSKFNYYHPDSLVVTSIEMDHPDLFLDIRDLKERFTDLLASLPAAARVYLCGDDPGTAELAAAVKSGLVTYGSSGDWRMGAVHFTQTGLDIAISHGEQELGQLFVGLYGRHNVLNALAAVAVALDYGVSWDQVVRSAAKFKGTARRFSILTAAGSPIRLIDDYAHHPTAARATIEAVKLHFPGRVIAVYQPHTFSRTKTLMSEYQQAFGQADLTFLAPVEGAREQAQADEVSSHDIAKGAAGQVEAIDDRAQLIKAVVTAAQPGDTVLVMSVGGYQRLAEELADKLENQS